MIALRIIYFANVIVAGWIGITSLFSPSIAAQNIFENVYKNTEVIRLVGALWLSICILSVFGMFKPVNFSSVLILQLFYKGSWLLVVALPAVAKQSSYPKGMTSFFVAWVLVLPFFIPWKKLFDSTM